MSSGETVVINHSIVQNLRKRSRYALTAAREELKEEFLQLVRDLEKHADLGLYDVNVPPHYIKFKELCADAGISCDLQKVRVMAGDTQEEVCDEDNACVISWNIFNYE